MERPIRSPVTDDDLISEAELNVAREKLSRNKAVGLDQLKDRHFHNDLIWEKIQNKIKNNFNRWITELRIPQYLKVAKIIPLSKDEDNSPFPKLGDIRTIAVAPAITKLFELCLL